MPLSEVPPVTPPEARPAVPSGICPVCQSPKWRSRKELKLYDIRVCKRCYYRLANRRHVAFVIDILALNMAQFILWFLIGRVSEGMTLMTPAGFDMVVMGIDAFCILAFAFRDCFGGHSPGKALMGVQVVSADTLEPIGYALSFKRNLPILLLQGADFVVVLVSPIAGVLASLIVVVLFLVMAYQLNRGPRWGDRFAGTKVIWKKHRHRVPFDTRGILCQGCGYDLTGNVSGVCPECGKGMVKPHGDEGAEHAQQDNVSAR